MIGKAQIPKLRWRRVKGRDLEVAFGTYHFQIGLSLLRDVRYLGKIWGGGALVSRFRSDSEEELKKLCQEFVDKVE